MGDLIGRQVSKVALGVLILAALIIKGGDDLLPTAAIVGAYIAIHAAAVVYLMIQEKKGKVKVNTE